MFNFGGNKVKSITISPSDKYVIWEEKLEDLAKDCDLIVSPGCVGLYIVNGALKSLNTPGKWIINTKDEVKDKSNLTLIAVNSDKLFDVFCGVGNIPYHDLDLEIDGTVGAHGECKLRISHAWALFTSLGRTPITAAEIDEFAKAKLVEIMSSQIAAAVSKYSYDDVKAKQSEISAELEKQIGKAIINIGLEVETFSLRGITFSQEYMDKRQAYFENEKKKKEEKRERRENERAQRAELENVISIVNATKNLAPQAPAAAPEAPARPNHTVRYCPKCGAQLPADAKFCSVCGEKL